MADDTWLIQQMQRAVIGPLWVYLHSFVINGLDMFNCWNCPWCKLVDQAKFDRHVDRVQRLDIEVSAWCHPRLIRRPQIDQASSMIRDVPKAAMPALPGHTDLEALMLALATGREYVWYPPTPQ